MTGPVFYDIARWRLDEQLTEIRELNSRLAGVFTAATALLVLFAAFQGFNDDLGNSTFALLGARAAIYALLVLATILGLRNRRLELGPNLGVLRELNTLDSAGDDAESGLKQLVADEIVNAVDANEGYIRRKAIYAGIAIWLWGIDVIVLVAVALSSVL